MYELLENGEAAKMCLWMVKPWWEKDAAEIEALSEEAFLARACERSIHLLSSFLLSSLFCGFPLPTSWSHLKQEGHQRGSLLALLAHGFFIQITLFPASYGHYVSMYEMATMWTE